jgi:hypothetical protein
MPFGSCVARMSESEREIIIIVPGCFEPDLPQTSIFLMLSGDWTVQNWQSTPRFPPRYTSCARNENFI